MGDITTGCKNINCERIKEVYAPKHNMINFPPDLKILFEPKMTKTGPFKMKAKSGVEIERWYTSSKNICKTYTLLHDLYHFNKDIHNMKMEDLWSSHHLFKRYPLTDFKRYDNNMKNLVSMKEQRAATENAIYLEGMQHHQQKLITCRGTLFYSSHPARKLLINSLTHMVAYMQQFF